LIPRAAVNVTDPGTDFSTDKAFVVNEDAAQQETLFTNYWLCMIDKFNYSEKLNQGPYNIVINLRSCFEKVYPGISNLYNESFFIIEGTVKSSRSNNASPHNISAWLNLQSDKQNSGNPAEIQSQMLIQISIYHNVSPEYPYGHFDINLADVEDAGKRGGIVGEEFRSSYATYRSFLINNLPVFQSASYDKNSEADGGNIDESATSVLLTTDTRNVVALYSQTSSSNTTPNKNDIQSTLMEFNQNYALSSQFSDPAQITANQLCLSRNELRDKYWGYNLYYNTDRQFRGQSISAGQRVDLVSNVDFRYQGNYGIIDKDSGWLENNGVLPDDAVISSLYNNRQYTAHVAFGTLQKYSRDPIPLSGLQGQSFIYYGSHPSSTVVFGKWIIIVDPTTNDVVFDKIVISTPNGDIEATTFDHDNNSGTPEVAVAATLTLPDGDSLTLYDKLYTNNYSYALNSQILAAGRVAYRLSSENINITNTSLFPNTVAEIPLYCYFDCPIGGLTQNDVDAATLISALNHPDSVSTPWEYTLKNDNLKLLLYDKSNNKAVDASNLDLTKFIEFTVRSGKMSPNLIPVADITKNTLDQLNEAYEWSTGPQFYIQMVTLTDSAGELLVFDNPIEIQYTHDAANDINNTDPATILNDGKTFSLKYDDNRLSGLPYSSSNSDFSYDINLADGTVLSSTADGDFATRASFTSKQLQIKPIENCSNLDLDLVLKNKSLAFITTKEIPDVPFTVGDKPTVNSPTIISR